MPHPRAQIALLLGDPTKGGAVLEVRLKFPANFAFPRTRIRRMKTSCRIRPLTSHG
jgi:hypothetical protein